jgi:hypothetical protein
MNGFILDVPVHGLPQASFCGATGAGISENSISPVLELHRNTFRTRSF